MGWFTYDNLSVCFCQIEPDSPHTLLIMKKKNEIIDHFNMQKYNNLHEHMQMW